MFDVSQSKKIVCGINLDLFKTFGTHDAGLLKTKQRHYKAWLSVAINIRIDVFYHLQ